MTNRKYIQDDYSLVSSWWNTHGSPALPEKLLPPTGFIIEDDIPLCAGWLYKTDGGICMMENFIGNPDAPKEKRKDAVNLLLELLVKEAKDTGFIALLTTTKNERLIEYGTKKFNFKEIPDFRVFVKGL